MTGQFPLFGMTMLSWLTFNINVNIFTQAEDPLNSTWTQDIGCTFDNEGNAKYCGWKPQNWEIVQMLTKSGLTLISSTGKDYYIYALVEGSPSNITSPYVTTGENTDCLEFYFFVTGINATLMVSIQRKDDTKTILWKYMSNNYISNRAWSFAALPFTLSEDFRVIIETLPTSDIRSVIAVDGIKHYRNVRCPLTPTEAEVDQTTSLSISTALSDIVSSSLRSITSTLKYTPSANSVSPGTTYPHTFPTDDDKEKEPDTADNSTAVLAGAATAGVVLLVIIVVIVGFVIRKTRSRINSKKAEEITNDNMEPSRETAAAPDIPSATETHYDGLGELSPQSHYASLAGTQSASEAAASYYNVDDSSQPGRHGPRRTSPAETPYGLGEPSPLSVYTSLQNTAAASDTGTYYSNDFAQDNGSYYNVTPGNSA